MNRPRARPWNPLRRLAARAVALWLVLAVVATGQAMHAPEFGHASGHAMAAGMEVAHAPDPVTVEARIPAAASPDEACAGPRCGTCVAFVSVALGDSPLPTAQPPVPAALAAPLAFPERLYRPPTDSVRA